MVRSSRDILNCERPVQLIELSVYSLNRAMPMASRKVFSRVSTGLRIVMCLDITPFHRKRIMKVMITTHAKNTSRLYRNSWRLREYRMPCICTVTYEKKSSIGVRACAGNSSPNCPCRAKFTVVKSWMIVQVSLARINNRLA